MPWLSWLVLGAIHPGLEKLLPTSLSVGWTLGHLSWTVRSDAVWKRKGEKKGLGSICSERVRRRTWCYRLEIHFRQEDQCEMGQRRSNNWMAPFQDDLFHSLASCIRLHCILPECKSLSFFSFDSSLKLLDPFLFPSQGKVLTVLISVIKYTKNLIRCMKW